MKEEYECSRPRESKREAKGGNKKRKSRRISVGWARSGESGLSLSAMMGPQIAHRPLWSIAHLFRGIQTHWDP